MDLSDWTARCGNVRFTVETVRADGTRDIDITSARLVRPGDPIHLDYVACDGCGQTMRPGAGCSREFLTINGESMRRVPAMGALTWNGEAWDATPCHDCNVVPGQFHHLGCDVESCPMCGHQLISCDCDCAELPFTEDE